MNIGKSVVIKGELSGSEDLTIEGNVEGKIELRDNTLTIGPNGKIRAEVFAKQVIVLGEVTGNVTASEKVDIRDNGSVDGDVTSPRVAIAEGAHFRGAIDMQQKSGKPGRPRRTPPWRPAPVPAAPVRGQGRASSPRGAGARPASAPGACSVAGGLHDLLSRFGGRRDEPSATPAFAGARHAGARLPDQGAAEVPRQRRGEAGAGAARPRPGRRHQRVVLRRGARLPHAGRGPVHRHRAPRRRRHPRPAAGLLSHAVQERAGQRRRHPLLGRVRLPRSGGGDGAGGDAGAAAGRRRLAARLLQHRHRTRTGALHEVRRRRSRHACAIAITAAPRRGSAAFRTATSSSCSRRSACPIRS